MDRPVLRVSGHSGSCLSRKKKWGQTPFSLKKGSDPISTERIESGWWDGRDVRRDYHIVVGADGEKLWFYRDCLTHEWYLHGIFG